ncbi:MAG: enoyl-CoA hydratase [Alphaproteobacteria bacterium]|nr:enoyl-CoA hydratase [Alphaproteobacteria bacterium]
MAQDILVERADGVVTATLNRPESRNSLSDDMLSTLYDVMSEAEDKPREIRAIVIRGAGEHFMSGGDIRKFQGYRNMAPAERGRMFEKHIHGLHPVIFKMRRIPQPIIASVRGGCAGFGMSLMMACDLAIASEDAFFTLAYCKIGTSPDGSATYTLPRLVGTRKALEIALLGDRFDAAEALRLGLVNRVVPTAKLEAETLALAKRLGSGPGIAYGNIKRLIGASLDTDIEAQLAAEARNFAACAASKDFMEGVSAFLEKRPAQFKGE